MQEELIDQFEEDKEYSFTELVFGTLKTPFNTISHIVKKESLTHSAYALGLCILSKILFSAGAMYVVTGEFFVFYSTAIAHSLRVILPIIIISSGATFAARFLFSGKAKRLQNAHVIIWGYVPLIFFDFLSFLAVITMFYSGVFESSQAENISILALIPGLYFAGLGLYIIINGIAVANQFSRLKSFFSLLIGTILIFTIYFIRSGGEVFW